MPKNQARIQEVLFSAHGADAILVAAVAMTLAVMVFPVPARMLDVLLAANISFSVLLVLMAVMVERPLDFRVFPSVLLMATLFRLSLNVASTRLILLNGDQGTQAAGRIIQSFGGFVVGGNTVVGLVVFSILVVVNFVVITKGAARIAEVAARFTLDALPGKQMSIDADLANGSISSEEARKKRGEIATESHFYGAMDGAGKFVRGDAVAGVLIILVNILGGFCIGVFQQGMTLADAVRTYVQLTVGDGLVTQIPALMISTSAAVLVSRNGQDKSLGRQMGLEFLSRPGVLFLTAGIAALFGLVPGLPAGAFLLFAGGIAVAGYLSLVRNRESEPVNEEKGGDAAGDAHETTALPGVEPLALEVGYGLVDLVERTGGVVERVQDFRRKFALETGLLIPTVHIRDNAELDAREYRILLKGVEIGRNHLPPGRCLAVHPGGDVPVFPGIETREPVFGLPACWIHKNLAEDARKAGLTVAEPVQVVSAHLSEMVRQHADELVTRQEVQDLIERIRETHPRVVEELQSAVPSLGTVQAVLRNLLRESVSIRDMLTIVETLADHAAKNHDPVSLTEAVRKGIARSIISPLADGDGVVWVFTLAPDLERIVESGLVETDDAPVIALNPDAGEKIMDQIKGRMEEAMALERPPVLMCRPDLRFGLKRFTATGAPSLVVLSYQEIPAGVHVKSLGTVASPKGRKFFSMNKMEDASTGQAKNLRAIG